MILRIKGYQEFACYRKPITYNFWESYPLPTPSNLRGWFHKVVGATEYIPMSVGITGRFQSIVYDLQKLIKFDRVRGDEDKKSSTYLEGFNSILNTSPTYVANLYGVELVIYIKSDTDYLKKFVDNVLKYEYPSLGRREDLIRIDELKYIEPSKLEDYHSIDYGIYLNKQTADKLSINGINYRMNFKYECLNNIRYFEKRDVVYVDTGFIMDADYIYIDEEENRIVDLIGD
ncbi:MAG: type I-B CRISPR-associated protein Cas5b [Hydrogenothermaceae bacterium]